MFITFDYVCNHCGADYPNMRVKRAEIEDQTCGQCYSKLKRKAAGPITTFKFGDRAAIKSRKAVSLRDKH